MRSINLIKQWVVTLSLALLLFGPFAPLAQAQTPTPIASPVTQSANPVGNGNIGCSLSDHWDICISNVVYYIAVGLGSAVAYIGAYVFDVAVQLSLNSLAYSLDFIAQSWETVRDIANMAFLFLLIYIAITIMLAADTSDTMKTLVSVIIIALLVNFSFFFSRVVIDTGNILAVQFYNAVPVTAPAVGPGGCASSFQSLCPTNTKDLSSGIMNALGVQQLLGGTSFQNFANVAPGNTWSQWFTNVISLSFLYLCIGAVFWILFIMFMSAGIRFLMRIVVLWFAIIASPLALVAYTTTATKKYYTRWQKILVSNALYPAFFMFMFWVLSKLVAAIAPGGGTNLIDGAFSTLSSSNTSGQGFTASVAVGAGNIGIRLALIVGVMYLGLRVSETVANMGAGMVEGVGKGVNKGIWKTVRGGGGYALGGAAALPGRITNSRGFKQTVSTATNTGVNSTLWRGLNRVLGGTNTPKPSYLTLGGILQNRRQQNQQTPQNNPPNTTPPAPNTPGGRNRLVRPPGTTGAANANQTYRPRPIPQTQSQGGGPINPPSQLGVSNGQRIINPPSQWGSQPVPENISAQRALRNLYQQAAGEQVKNTIRTGGEQIKNTTRAGATSLTLTREPDMARSNTQARPPQAQVSTQDVAAMRQDMQGLGQAVREVVGSLKNNQLVPARVVVSVPKQESQPLHITTEPAKLDESELESMAERLAKKVGPRLISHMAESTPPDGRGPSPAAPAARRPLPPQSNSEGETLPKAA